MLFRPSVNPSLGQTVCTTLTQILPIFFSVNHMALPHPHASGMLHMSFKSLLASRRSHFRGGGWLHNPKKSTQSEMLMDLSHSHNDVATAVWGWKNAEAKNKLAPVCGILMFYMKTCQYFSTHVLLSISASVDANAPSKQWRAGGLWIICSSSQGLIIENSNRKTLGLNLPHPLEDKWHWRNTFKHQDE